MSDKCQPQDRTRPEAEARSCAVSENLYNDVRDSKNTLSFATSDTNANASKVLAPLEIVDDSKPGHRHADDTENRRGHGHHSEKHGTRVGLSEQGEVIKRDVAPQELKVKPGTNLNTIAREHLGAGATDEEVKAHVKEIARINGIKNPDQALDVKSLTLPGHTKDGGFVTQDSHGNKRTVWHDGSVRIENKDGSGYAHKSNADGSYNEFHWGKNKQDNYALRKLPDGKYETSDVGAINFKPAADGDNRVEMAKLKELADKKITDPADRARFEADMNKFASRQQDLIERFEKQGLSAPEAQKKAADEVSKTYQQVEKLLTAQDNPNLKTIKEKDRIAIAEQVMHNAATPTDISQGSYSTCNVTVIEVQTYTKEPSEAARLVTDMALTGKYTSNGKPPVTVEVGKDINADSLKKHGDAKNSFEPGENNRSHASQIFEVTAVNLHYTKENAKTNPPGQIRYEQHDPKGETDNGERLVDYSKKDPKTGKAPAEVMVGGEPVRSPDLSAQEIANVARDIQGDKGTPVRIDIDPIAANMQDLYESRQRLLGLSLQIQGIGDGKPVNFDDPNEVKRVRETVAHTEMPQDKRKELNYLLNQQERDHAYTNRDGIAYVRDEKQLAIALKKLNDEGQLPIIVGVHTGTEPFTTDANSNGARGGKHVVTVSGIKDGAPPTVSIDNQWDVSADHSNLPIGKLYESMQFRDPAVRISGLQKEVDANRQSGKIDYTKETELLFERYGADKINDQQLIDGIAKVYEDAGAAKKIGRLNQEQESALLVRLRELRDQLKPDQQAKLIERLKVIKAAREKQH